MKKVYKTLTEIEDELDYQENQMREEKKQVDNLFLKLIWVVITALLITPFLVWALTLSYK